MYGDEIRFRQAQLTDPRACTCCLLRVSSSAMPFLCSHAENRGSASATGGSTSAGITVHGATRQRSGHDGTGSFESSSSRLVRTLSEIDRQGW